MLSNSNNFYLNFNSLTSNQFNSDQFSLSSLSPTCLSNTQNPQVSLSEAPVNNSMSENSSEPSYTNEIPIVNNFSLRNYLSNRDSILREIRDCIISKEEERCRTLSKQVHAHWKSLSTRNGCIIVDNRVVFPNSIKEAVTDVLHPTHPRSWGIIELEKCIWDSATETYSIGFDCVKRGKSLVGTSNQSYQQIKLSL